MGIKQGSKILTAIALITCITCQECPPTEDIPYCNCNLYNRILSINCFGYDTGFSVEDYVTALESVSEQYTIGIAFERFNRPHNLSSRSFDGLPLKGLKFYEANISRWSDEEGGPAFVGQENSLEILELHSSLRRPTKHADFSRETAPFTFDHLRRLRKLDFQGNDLYYIGNGWFVNGPNSLEILILSSDKIRALGDRAFAGLTNLKELEAKGNKIVEVSRNMLPKPAFHLKVMDFAHNELNVLPKDIFEDMPLLERVHLSGNKLIYIHERTWLPVWTQLWFVALNNNPLHCDEHIEWIFKVKVPETFVAQCHSPESMRDKYLKDLIKERERKN